MPGYGVKLNEDPDLVAKLEADTAKALQLDTVNASRSYARSG